MSLDGLRAWIGEVERKLGVRTRVFLVMAVIALGAAGAAIYLALDTRNNAIDKDDVPALETQATEDGGAEQLAAEVEALRQEIRDLKEEGAAGAASGAGGDSTSPNGAGGSTPGTAGTDSLKKALEQAQKEAEKSAGK